MSPGPGKLFRELRRRRVFNTLVIYIVGAWVVLQAVDLALPGLDKPGEAIRYAWYAVFALAPLVILFAWRYDVSATGIHRTLPEGLEQGAVLQRPDRILIGSLGIAGLAVIVAMSLQIARFEAPAADAVRANSIAVLSFGWCGDLPGDVALAGGIQGAVIDRLAARERLKVTGRNTMYRVAGLPLEQLVSTLQVQYLLSGELCEDGAALTLRAELTDRDNALVWSGTFRQVTDADNRVEQELAVLVANGVAVHLGDVALAGPARAVDARALQSLRAGQYHRDQGNENKARQAFEEALEYDPDYAEALFELALVTEVAEPGAVAWIREVLPIGQRALDLARAEIESGAGDHKAHWVIARILMALSRWEQDLTWRTALELDNDEVERLVASAQDRLVEAEQHLRTAIRLNPSETRLYAMLTDNLRAQAGARHQEALELLKRGLQLDPFNGHLTFRYAKALVQQGQYRQSMEEIERWRRELGELPDGLQWAQFEIQLDYGAVDDRLSVMLDILSSEPEKVARSSGIRGHMYWMAAWLAALGLPEEAEDWYRNMKAIPDDEENWARWLFLHGAYRMESGDEEAFTREMVARWEGMSNAEILDQPNQWLAKGSAASFWAIGERERALELAESAQHFRLSPFWAERQTGESRILAKMYLMVGRDSEATIILQNVIDHLEEEVNEGGIRHPSVLASLAATHALLGHDQEALDLLTMAVDYGGAGLAAADAQDPDYPDPWKRLRGNPRFQQQVRRSEAIEEAQRQNIRAMLAGYDLGAAVAPVIEMRTELMAQAEAASAAESE